jgi:hypothetical protein
MLKLPNVTLIALTSVRIPETIKALEYSCKHIEFGKLSWHQILSRMIYLSLLHTNTPKKVQTLMNGIII